MAQREGFHKVDVYIPESVWRVLAANAATRSVSLRLRQALSTLLASPSPDIRGPLDSWLSFKDEPRHRISISLPIEELARLDSLLTREPKLPRAVRPTRAKVLSGLLAPFPNQRNDG